MVYNSVKCESQIILDQIFNRLVSLRERSDFDLKVFGIIRNTFIRS